MGKWYIASYTTWETFFPMSLILRRASSKNLGILVTIYSKVLKYADYYV